MWSRNFRNAEPDIFAMERYKNLSGNSGVVEYEIGPTFVKVRFSDGTIYRYTESSAGARHIQRMKNLARKGLGLSSFISSTVGEAYASKGRDPTH
jgi:hypothetical protein